MLTINVIFRYLKNKINEIMNTLRSIYYSHLFASCGRNLKINGKCKIYFPDLIHVGDNVTINYGVQLAPKGKIYIGNNVVMSRGSQITAGQLDTSSWDVNGPHGKKHVALDVVIADGTWLCVNSIILPGVHILGKGVIVAAGAVVTKNVLEDFVIMGGVPAKVVGHVKIS